MCEESEKTEIQKPERWFGIRRIQYVLFFSAALLQYTIRVSFNVGIIAMIATDSPGLNNSLLSALPYLVLWLLSMLLGYVSDYLIIKKYTTVTMNRKIFNLIAMFIPATALIVSSFVGSTDRVIAITLLVIAVGCTAAVFCSFTVNLLDLSPNYAGTLLAVANTASTVFSLLAPLSIDAYTYASGYKETDKELWTIVFCTAAGIYIFAGVVFVFLSSGEVQEWDSPDYVRKSKKCKKNCTI